MAAKELYRILGQEETERLGAEKAWLECARQRPELFAPFPEEAPALTLAFCYARKNSAPGLHSFALPAPARALYERYLADLQDLLCLPGFGQTENFAFDGTCSALLWSRSLSALGNPGWSFSPWALLRSVVLFDLERASRLAAKQQAELLLHEQLHSAIDHYTEPEEDLLSLPLARAFDERVIGWLLGEEITEGWSPQRSAETASYFLHLDSECLLAEEEEDVARLLNKAAGKRRRAEWWLRELAPS